MMTYMRDHRMCMAVNGKAYVTLDMTNLCPFVRIVLDGKNCNLSNDK